MELATTSGNDPLSPSRQLGCDTCRISGRIGCRPAARTQRVRINSPVPTPGGTVGKIGWSGVRESNPPHLLGRQRPEATRPTPLKWSGFVCRFTAPRLHATDRSVRRTLGGVSGGLRAGPLLSLPVCPRPCAGGKADQNSTVLTRGRNAPSEQCNHDWL